MTEKPKKAKIDALKKKIDQQLKDAFGPDGVGTPVEGPIEVNLSGKTFEEMKASLQENLGKKFDPSNIVAHTTSEPDPTDDLMSEIKKAQEALLKHGHATFKSDQITLSSDGITIGDFTLKSDGTAAVGDVTSHYTVTPPDSSFKPMGWGKDASPEDTLNDLKAFKEKYAPKTEYKSAHTPTDTPAHASDEALAKLKEKLLGSYGATAVGVQSGSFMQLDQHGKPMGGPVPLSAMLGDAPKKPTAESLLVELAGASGVAKYVHAKINADWDPKDHPRDPNTGEFVKGPVGYIFGKAKKATFKGIKTTNGLKDLEFDLKPGDVAFQTPGKNIVVSHANGDYTLYNAATGEDSVIPAGSKDTLAEWAQNGMLKKVAENPGTNVKASTKEAAAKMIAEPEKFTAEGKMKGAKVPPAKTTDEVLKQATDADMTVGNIVYKSPTPGATAWEIAWVGAGHGGGIGVSLKKPGTAGGTTNAQYIAKSLYVKSTPSKTTAEALKDAKAAQKDPVLPDQINVIKGGSITPAPEFKPGKTKYTAKQVTQFQAENDGKMLDADKSGQTITSGSWVDINGTPYQVFASPYNPKGGFTAYKWVKTKQQAANESKEDPFQLGDATVIPDPTGKPYLGVGLHADESLKPKAADVSLGTGSLMSQADTTLEIPNASVVHAKHLAEAQGKPLDISGDVIDDDAEIVDPLVVSGTELFSGDWVEIGGKPYQVHSSPNAGNIALKKWVGTKKQAATTSYDFPAGVLKANDAVAIGDPTGNEYKPLTDAQKTEALGPFIEVDPEDGLDEPESDGLPAGSIKDEISQFPEPEETPEPAPVPDESDDSEIPETEPEPTPGPSPLVPVGTTIKDKGGSGFVYTKGEDGLWHNVQTGAKNSFSEQTLADQFEVVPTPEPLPDPFAEPVLPAPTAVGTISVGGKTYVKMSDDTWQDYNGSSAVVPGDIESQWLSLKILQGEIESMQVGDTLHAQHLTGKKSTYTVQPDGLVHASGSGQTASLEKLSNVVAKSWDKYTFSVEKNAAATPDPEVDEPDQTTTAIDHVTNAQPGDTLEWGYYSFDPDLYTKQADGTWTVADTAQQANDLDYEPAINTQDEVLMQLQNSGSEAKYLTFTKKAESIEDEDTEQAVAAPAPANVLSLFGDMAVTIDPGDQVFKHTGNDILYAVKKATGGITVYSNTGLVFPTSADPADTGDWAEVDTWPGKVGGEQSIYTPDPWVSSASGAPNKVTEDVSGISDSFDPLKAKPGDQLTLSGAAGADEVYTYNGPVTLKGKPSGTWTMSAADQPGKDIVFTNEELKQTLHDLLGGVSVSYASETPLTTPDHPFSSADGQAVAQSPLPKTYLTGADALPALNYDAKPGDQVTVNYVDGVTETMYLTEVGWMPLDETPNTFGDGYSNEYLAGIIDGDTTLTLTTNSDPVTLEATPQPEPAVSGDSIPAGTSLKGLLTEDGMATTALLDNPVQIGSDNIEDVPVGTKVHHLDKSISSLTKNEHGSWVSDTGHPYPTGAVLAGVAAGQMEASYDFSDLTFFPTAPKASVVQVNSALIDTAMPGDKVQLDVGGVQFTYTKVEDGWTSQSGHPATAATIKALVTGAGNGTFVYAGNDHTAASPVSDSENPNLPDGITEGVGTTKPGPEKTPKQTSASKAKAAQTNDVMLPDGTAYTLKPGEALGYIEDFTGGGHSKPEISVLVTASGENKVWNAEGALQSLSKWWAPDKALMKMTPTSLKTAINKYGGELHGSNTYKKAKTDAASYGTFDDATDVYINSFLEATEPTAGAYYLWESHNNPFSNVRATMLNLIHGGVASASVSPGYAAPGEDGYKGIVPLSYWGIDAHTAFYPDADGNMLSWNSLDDMTKASVVAKVAPIAAGIHNLINAHYTPELIESWDGQISDDLIKKYKARITANKNALLGLTRLGELAEALSDPDSTKTGGWTIDSLEAELGVVQKWATGPKHGMKDFDAGKVPIEAFVAAVSAAFQKRKFTEGLTGLDFDPLDASTEQYDAYAKSKGFDHLSLLSPADQKTWVLADLGDPSITSHQKNSISNNLVKAKQKAALATLSASLKADQVKSGIKPHADVPSAPEEGTGIYGITEMKQGLKKSYAWKFKGSLSGLTHLGDDDWLLSVEGSEPIHVNDAMAAAAIKSIDISLAKGENTYTEYKTSMFPAYAGVSVEQSIKSKFAEHGIDPGDLLQGTASFDWAEYANQHEAEITAAVVAEGFGAMNHLGDIPVAGLNWLAIKGSGDKVWDFLFQKEWQGHPPFNHPGDPDTPEGKAALTALANKVASLPGGEIYLSDNANSAQTASIATALGVPPMLANQWSHLLTGALLAQYKSPDLQQVTGDDLAPGETHANKPAGVSDEVWDVVVNATKDTDVSSLVGPTVAGYTEAQLEALLTQHTSAPFAGVPKPFKQLALWSYTASSSTSIPEYEEFATAVLARVQAGDFLSGSTAVWTHPETGSKFPVSPGAKVIKIASDDYITAHGYGAHGYLVTSPPDSKTGKPTSGFFFADGTPNTPVKKIGSALSEMSNHPTAQVLVSVPDPVTFEKAKAAKGPGLGSELTEPIWFKTEQIEQGKASVPSYGTNAVLTAALKSSDYLKANYPALYAQKTTLPEPVKNAIAWLLTGYSVEGIGGISSAGLTKGTKHPLLDLMEYKAGQGHFASMGSAGLFDASQPWNAYLSKGLTSPADVGKWSETATAAYVQHFGLQGVSQISPHLSAIMHPEAPTIETGISWKNLPDFNSLALTNTGKNPGGMHTKHVWVDTNGDEWMSKAFNSDPNAKARVDAETNANKIGALFGFGNPVAETVALTSQGKISGAGTGQGSGNYTYFQHMKPAVGSFSGKAPGDLTTKQLQQAMSHHVLDWIVSNHDTHSENLLLGKDGNVFGIDLGQAFKFFPNDKLAVGYLPPGNGAPVWYDQFYKGIKNGTIDKATADDVVKHVLRTAQRVAKTNDAEYKAMLTDALKNRENFPPQYPTMEKFIDALMERKHSTLDDFVALYQGIYATSPYEWDIDPENLTPPKIGDTHVSVTSELTKSVMKSKAAGQALMVNSLDLEDSYLMLQPQKDKGGKHLLLGEAKVRKDGDKKLVAWLKQQTVVDNTSNYGYDDDYDNSVYEGPSSSTPVWSTLPANSELFSAMVNYSKTVSSHNKSGDHAYNANTVSIATTAKAGIDSMLKSMEYWEKQNPGVPYAGKPTGYFADYTTHMYTMEQHEAFRTMLETYQGYFDKVKEKEGSDQKVTPHFTQVTYSPSAGVKAAYFAAKGLPVEAAKAEPGTSVTWKVGSTTYVATKGGKSPEWTLSTQVGKNEPTTQVISNFTVDSVLQSEPSVEPTDKSAIKPVEQVEESATVKVGTKVLKVSLKNAAYPKATFDHSTGEQNRLGGESTGGYQNSGQMFEVDFGNVKITYRPWDSAYGVAAAQQGLLKFEKSDWDGNSSDAPASLNEILDVLRQMGLDLDAADETSLETFYWAHMAGVLADRKDGNNAKWGKVNKHLKDKLNDHLSPTERLEVYREAWAKAIGAERVDQVTSTGWWRPRLSHTSLHAIDTDDIEDGQVKSDAEGTGRPYWFRPDLTMEELYAKVGNESPSSNLTYGGNWGDAALIATSGGSLSSEERARFYGHQAKGGASSGSDADKGSSGFVFMRSQSTNQHQSGQVYYHPRVYLRTTNYGFDSDNYGNTSLRKTQSTWDPANSFSHGTEYMTKGSVSVLSDYAILTFQTEQQRLDAIKAYKERGITKINGIPIEEMFHTGKVSQSTYDSIIKRLWKQAIEEEKQMEVPA